jgi:hypothetical protein
MLRQLQFSVAEDSVRNEYQLHRQIHEWLSNAQYTDVEALNTRVYSQLFLAPLDDPWYGLKPAFAYSAIDFDGPSVIPAPTPASASTDARSQR